VKLWWKQFEYLLNMPERESPKQEIKNTQVDALADLLSNAENISALRGKKFDEVFSGDENVRSFVEGLDEPAFVELLNSINGIIQGKDKIEWQMAKGSVPITMGGKGEGLPGYIPPYAEDRTVLFAEALGAMKEMVRDGRSLEDVAIMLSSTINAVHAYSDANGRTSRLLYLLITEGLNMESESVIKRALSEDGRGVVDINPEKIESDLQNVLILKAGLKRAVGVWESEKSRRDISFGENLSGELKAKLLEMLADVSYGSIALHKYLNDKPDAQIYFKNYPAEEVAWGGRVKVLPERNNVLVDVLFKNLDDAQAREILSIYGEIKSGMVRILIDSVVHPDKPEYVGADGVSILEKFKQKIERVSEIE